MSYRLEGKDIIISGFDQGVAPSPYQGLGDMRNIDIVGVPGEASVSFENITATLPPLLNNIAYTASASTDRLTVADASSYYEGMAISLNLTALSITYLMAGAGGGSGGTSNEGGSGGGGAGRVRTATIGLDPGVYPIEVGTGGAGGAATGGTGIGAVGGDTTFNGLTAEGGGYGGGARGLTINGGDGANGGGSACVNAASPAVGTPGNGNPGNDGGAGQQNGTEGGGGGSDVAAGQAGATGVAGAGGPGTSSSISGAAVLYGKGGDGGGSGTVVSTTPGSGGEGVTGLNVPGVAGQNGIVIISYPTGSLTATGGTITTSGGNTIHTFTTNGDFEILAGPTENTVYYVRNIVGNTFQLSLSPTGVSGVVDIEADHTGTLTSYQYGNQRGVSGSGAPISYFIDTANQGGLSNAAYLVDHSNYVWMVLPAEVVDIPANTLIFLGNIGGNGALSVALSGLVVWQGYIVLFGLTYIDIADLNTLFFSGPAAAWIYDWETITQSNNNARIGAIVSQEDNSAYWTSSEGLGTIIEVPGETFDPTDDTTYEISSEAILLPSTDKATCLCELGSFIYIGGRNSFVYEWDKISPGFNTILTVPDTYINNLVGTGQNVFIFAGQRGRVYITNGASVDLFLKFSDYLTGIMNPYVRWYDANYSRGHLLFSAVASSNADAEQETIGGVWGVYLPTQSLRMLNKFTSSGYGGQGWMVAQMPIANLGDLPAGNGLIVGWYNDGEYGVDVGSSDPYSNYESYIDTDFIPVGSFLTSWSPTQLEWKTSTPLVAGERVKISYRRNITESFTQVGESTTAGALSDLYKANFQKVQWVQFRIELQSTASSPSFVRLTEMRIRDWPSQ